MKINFSEKIKGITGLILLALIFAVLGAVVRLLEPYQGVIKQIHYRVVIGAAILLVFYVRQIRFKKLRNMPQREIYIVFMRSIILVPAGILWVKAITMSKLFNVTLIDSIPAPSILGWLILREKFSVEKFGWTLFAFLGVVIVSLKNISGSFTLGIGELYLVASVFLFAFRNVTRRWHKDYLNDHEITFFMLLIPAIFFFFMETREPWIWQQRFNLFIFLLTFFGGLLTLWNFFLTNYGFKRVEAVLGGNILQLEAMFGLLLGFLLFRESPTIIEIIGAIILSFSVYRLNLLESGIK